MALDNALALRIIQDYLGGSGYVDPDPNLMRNLASAHDQMLKRKRFESMGYDPNIVDQKLESNYFTGNPISNTLGDIFSTDDNLKKNINYAFGDFSGNTSEDAQILIDTLSKLRTSDWKFWEWVDADRQGDASFLSGNGFRNLSKKQKQEIVPWLLHIAKNDPQFKALLNEDNQKANMYLSSLLQNLLTNKGQDYSLLNEINSNPKANVSGTNTNNENTPSTPPTPPTVEEVLQNISEEEKEAERQKQEEFEKQIQENFNKRIRNRYVDPYANNELRRKNREYMENRGY